MTSSEVVEEISAAFDISSPAYAMYQALNDLSANNAEYFQCDDSENGQRLHGAFLALIDHINIAAPLVDQVRKVAHEYDFDSKTPFNGYRSFVSVLDLCVLHCVKINRQIIDGRDSFLFRKGHFMREMESCSQLMASLATCMAHLQTLISWSRKGDLFPYEEHSSEELLKLGDTINMYCFYGRCLGFQFCDSMKNILKTISISMATFSEMFYNSGGRFSQATSSVVAGSKFLWNPELRARRIVNISQNSSIDFCKAFWFLGETEMAGRVPAIVCPTLAVNKVISIPPEPLEHETHDGVCISVPIPSSHIGLAPISVRLISAVRRRGMISEGVEGESGVQPPSNVLLIHCHGGGFVAQSSRSHEIYLRDWAHQLNVPIFSIDYSLAPKAPFPRALEEVVYAYCWAIKNCNILGTTAEKIIFIGDSAGANLMLGVTLKCIELGLQPPSGLFLAYVPVLVSFHPSPSRLLCLMDPMMPFGFMLRCLKAYACPEGNSPVSETQSLSSITTAKGGSRPNSLLNGRSISNGFKVSSDTESFEEVSESDFLDLAAHKSPLSENSDTLISTFSLSSLQSKTEGDPESTINTIEEKKDDDTKVPKSGSHSELYVSEFIEKYVLDSETDSNGRKVPVLRTERASEHDPDEHVLFEIPQDLGLQNKFEKALGSFTSGIANTYNYVTGSRKTTPQTDEESEIGSDGNKWTPLQSPCISNLDTLIHRSPSDEFNFTFSRDPHMSPYWASDDILQQFPPVSLLSVQFDPCLDDCVMFARKLKRLGVETTLDVLEGLPHGFLNFATFSKEAHAGSNLCVKRIKELLEANSLQNA